MNRQKRLTKWTDDWLSNYTVCHCDECGKELCTHLVGDNYGMPVMFCFECKPKEDYE